MKHGSIGISVAVMVGTLAACGGGGSSSNEQEDLASKYVGVWTTGCFAIGTVTDAKTGAAANVTQTLDLAVKDKTTLTFGHTTTVYASTDLTCKETPLGTIVNKETGTQRLTVGADGITSSNGFNIITLDGRTKVGELDVDKITFSLAGLYNTLGASATYTAGTGNQFVIKAKDFLPSSALDLAYLKDDRITLGQATEPLGYPTKLSTSTPNIFVKKP